MLLSTFKNLFTIESQLNMFTTKTGYGVMTSNGPVVNEDDITDGDSFREPLTIENSLLVPDNVSSGAYGSLDNASISTTDSYNRWYCEDFGTNNDACSEFETNTASALNLCYDRRQSTFLGSEAGSEFYGEANSLLEQDGVLTLSSTRMNNFHGYIPHGEDTEGDENLIRNSLDRGITGIASTPLVTWNLLNMLLSTSLLGFPFIVQKGGYVVLPVVLVVAIILNYTSRILIDLMYENSSQFKGRKIRVRLDYIDLGRDVFDSNKGAAFVQIVQVIEMLAICILNICVLGELGHEITRKYSRQVCTVVAALFALPTFFIRKLVIIGWLQTIGVMFLVLGLVIVQGYCFIFARKWEPANIPVCDLKYIPIAIGAGIYAYGVQGIMPGLEEQMKKPKKFGSVVNTTFFTTFLIQCLFSITNAMFYGNKTEQVIIIDLKNHFALGLTTACFFGLSILSHFSLPTFVVMEKLDQAILQTSLCCSTHRQKFHTFMQVALRIGVLVLSVGVALALPYFAYLMAFIGSAITMFPSLLLPVVFHLKLRYDSLSPWQVLADGTILLLGILCLGMGCYFSLEAIYYDVTHSNDVFLF